MLEEDNDTVHTSVPDAENEVFTHESAASEGAGAGFLAQACKGNKQATIKKYTANLFKVVSHYVGVLPIIYRK